eukprot:GGOE01040947.1.p1 GENE.GGOE01040947.1~~GGOE01040947.1.p1  ORF type:complete len:922 (-),score=317.41 GGOE01040947.1:157-2703(-)
MAHVQPRKLLYIGMDGVAPRAKMNQQRARRFMSVKEEKARQQVEAELREKWQAAGLEPPSMPVPWDHNVITPGTPFMDRLSKFMRHYISVRVQEHPLWKDLVVFFSDSNEPSEGEHKVLQFIKRQRQAPGYDPNTTHYILGPDADLIQLALCTHEPHLYILRESKDRGGSEWNCERCKTRNRTHRIACFRCGNVPVPQDPSPTQRRQQSWRPRLQLLSIPAVRAYFDFCLSPILDDTRLPLELRDRERLYDDLILLFCFVGNDFLPHLPSMRIQQNALGRCLTAYGELFRSLGGYLTEHGEIHLPRLQQLLDRLVGEFSERDPATNPFQALDDHQCAATMSAVLERARYCNASQQKHLFKKAISLAMEKRTADELLHFSNTETVKIGTNGWQERYLQQKFGLDPRAPDYASQYTVLKQQLSHDYLLGLVWVVRYYYHQCRSWSWYFPHHFSPPLSLINTADLRSAHLDLNGPLRPFEQLLCVMPLSSAKATVPKELYNIVSQEPLRALYPTEFEVDLHNCPPPWMSVAMLPFVEETRLLAAVRPVEDALADKALRRRNAWRPSICVCRNDHPLARRLLKALTTGGSKVNVHKHLTRQGPGLPVSGKFILSPKLNRTELKSPSRLLPDIAQSEVLLCEYLVSEGGFMGMFTHNSTLVEGVSPPVVAALNMLHPLDDPKDPRKRRREVSPAPTKTHSGEAATAGVVAAATSTVTTTPQEITVATAGAKTAGVKSSDAEQFVARATTSVAGLAQALAGFLANLDAPAASTGPPPALDERRKKRRRLLEPLRDPQGSTAGQTAPRDDSVHRSKKESTKAMKVDDGTETAKKKKKKKKKSGAHLLQANGVAQP